jgi:hypothetical protein
MTANPGTQFVKGNKITEIIFIITVLFLLIRGYQAPEILDGRRYNMYHVNV